MKYFKEGLIGEHVDHHLTYDTLDQSGPVVNTVKAKIQTLKLFFTRASVPELHRTLEISNHSTLRFRGAITQIRSSSDARRNVQVG